jgi:hypothetical protein
VSLVTVDSTPLQLRQHAEHCRQLAESQVDERTRLILHTMASEFEQQALELDSAADKPTLSRARIPTR